jgi:hypothetical protein
MPDTLPAPVDLLRTRLRHARALPGARYVSLVTIDALASVLAALDTVTAERDALRAQMTGGARRCPVADLTEIRATPPRTTPS